MISIFLIKAALLRFGVVVQGISFDVDNEKIDVKYTLQGMEQTKSVTFSQIEELFKSDSGGPPGRPTSDPGYPAQPGPPYYAPPGLQQP